MILPRLVDEQVHSNSCLIHGDYMNKHDNTNLQMMRLTSAVIGQVHQEVGYL